MEAAQKCPMNESENIIKKIDNSRELLSKIFKSSPVKRLKNSYHFRHEINCYNYIGSLIQEKGLIGKYKPIYRAPTLAGEMYFVTEPGIIKALLKIPRLAKGELLSEGRQLRVIAEALGKYRLNNEKEDMKPKRSVLGDLLMDPEKYLKVMKTELEQLINGWQQQKSPFIITKDVSEMTVAIFLKSVMNYEGEVAPIVPILEEQIDLLGKRFSYRKCPQFNERFIELRNELMSYLFPAHQVQAKTESDYTKRLSGYINKHHKVYEEDAFATGVNSGTLAGYLAPNPAFISCVYELGKHPDWISQLREECNTKQKSNMVWETYVQAEDTLLNACIHEVLRLYPSQPFLFRNVEHNFTVLDQYKLTKGSQIVIDLYHSLRDTSRWGEDAEDFNPHRFIQKPELYKRPFLAYSTGPNICTGQAFSKLSLRVFLNSLVTNLNWETLNTEVKPRFHFAMTLNQDIKISVF
ncbi:MAG: cytochrome P450 [Tatlockia sp.]|nr:cytochrome P450 [Tatlockia sp.]